MDAVYARTDDRFAIFADPPGIRDLALPEVWERSAARSRRRRAAAAARIIALPKTATARISAALIAAGIVGQTGPLLGAAQAAQTTTLGRGAKGAGVATAQRALGLPADGIFGPDTRRAVRRFQRDHGLVVDGRIGPQTRAALGLPAHGEARAASTRHAAGAAARIDRSLPAATTRAIQTKLGIASDGVFGPQTRAAVRTYQRAHGLEVDGVAGPRTLASLGVTGTPATAADDSATAGQTTTAGSSTTTANAPTPTAGSGAQAAVAAAMSKVGARYQTGGNGPSAFDCSGLTSWAMRQAGVTIPRTSFAQFQTGSAVAKSAIQAGDLIFFDTAGPGASDVGIATSPTTVVSATTHGVMNHAIFDSYWGAHFVGARSVA